MIDGIPMTLPQLLWILSGCALLILVGALLAVPRRRHDRPVLAVEDPTPDLDRADTFTLDSHHDGRFIVADYGRMAALPEALYDDRCRDCERGCVGLVCPAVDTWQPARPGDTPGELVPGEGEIDPPLSLREAQIEIPTVKP
jgi:hypothetical protein